MEDEIPTARVARFRIVAVAVLAVMAAVTGCANYIGTTAASFMKVATKDRDPNKRHLAYAKLASPNCYDSEEQKLQVVKLLSQTLKSGGEPAASRAVICRTLGELRKPEARAALIGAAEDEEPLVRAEACRALGKVGRTEDISILSRHMAADTQVDCRFAAIEGIGEMRAADPNVETSLIDGMEDPDPGIRVACYRALKSIRGTDLGPEADPWRKDLASRTGKPSDKDSVQQASAPASR
jgi:HEAT repeat protein